MLIIHRLSRYVKEKNAAGISGGVLCEKYQFGVHHPMKFVGATCGRPAESNCSNYPISGEFVTLRRVRATTGRPYIINPTTL